jgi:hypothetical protein
MYVIVVGIPDLIGGTFYGPFNTEVTACVWAENMFPPTLTSGRRWHVVPMHAPSAANVTSHDHSTPLEV